VSTIAEKAKFARDHWSTPDGEPFEIDEDGWLWRHFFRPLHSFRLVPVDTPQLCPDCAKLAGTLTEDYYSAEKTRNKKHHEAKKCLGLEPVIIRFVLLMLRRQTGKTVGTSGFVGACLFKDDRQSIAFISGSEDQSAKLFRKHYKDPIKNNPALKSRAKIVGNRIHVPSTGSEFLFMATSLAGTTGGSHSVVIIDEARAVPDDKAVAFINTILAQAGWKCPMGDEGHTKTKGDLDEPKQKKCKTCGSKLVPWAAKVLIMSSAGEISGGKHDWFFDLVREEDENPYPGSYVFTDKDQPADSKVSESTVNAVSEFLGRSQSLRTYVDIETHNKPRERGEDVVLRSDLKRICSSNLKNEEGTGAPCVGFLDTSTTIEKTSVVILADDREISTEPWQHVYMSHCQWWWPGHGGVKVIDPEAVYKYLDALLPLYPNMQMFAVDTRVGASKHGDIKAQWPAQLVRSLRGGVGAWRKKITSWSGKADESDIGWDLLLARILSQTILIQDLKEIMDEFRGLTSRSPPSGNGRPKIVDRNRSKIHKDITESLALCCFLIKKQELRARAPGFASMVQRSQKRRSFSGPSRIGGGRLRTDDF